MAVLTAPGAGLWFLRLNRPPDAHPNIAPTSCIDFSLENGYKVSSFLQQGFDALDQFPSGSRNVQPDSAPETKAALRIVGQLASSTDLITTGRKTHC